MEIISYVIFLKFLSVFSKGSRTCLIFAIGISMRNSKSSREPRANGSNFTEVVVCFKGIDPTGEGKRKGEGEGEREGEGRCPAIPLPS